MHDAQTAGRGLAEVHAPVPLEGCAVLHPEKRVDEGAAGRREKEEGPDDDEEDAEADAHVAEMELGFAELAFLEGVDLGDLTRVPVFILTLDVIDEPCKLQRDHFASAARSLVHIVSDSTQAGAGPHLDAEYPPVQDGLRDGDAVEPALPECRRRQGRVEEHAHAVGDFVRCRPASCREAGPDVPCQRQERRAFDRGRYGTLPGRARAHNAARSLHRGNQGTAACAPLGDVLASVLKNESVRAKRPITNICTADTSQFRE